MILPLLLLTLALTTSARPQLIKRSACSGKSLMASGGGGDGPAPPLSQTELDTSLPLTRAELKECYGVEPMDLEDQGKEEGDMVRSYTASAVSVPEGVARSGISSVDRLWPAGRIPYELSSQFGSGARQAIAAAIARLQDATCLRVVAREAGEGSYIWIAPEDGCWSIVGRTGEKQTLSLGTGCVNHGTILHELLHAAGIIHEHSRPDRDSFVRILTENIRAGEEIQFEKYGRTRVAELDVGYDYGSLMHYPPKAFSKNGLPTIQVVLFLPATPGSKNEIQK